ncbi:hypothetical protein DESC_780200 [Desulfosarcina cetonica]|nr:hypothetical protein DESC_780200 [Desulfosarcina cetonica]
MTTQLRAFAPLLGLMVLLTVLTGCATFFQDVENRMNRQKFRLDYDTFDQILAIYDQGDVETALQRFNALANSTASPKLARDAGLGEICCRLILANSRESYATAIGLWHNFAVLAKENGYMLDPALLDPLIAHMIPQNLVERDGLQSPLASSSASGGAASPAESDQKTEEQRLKAEIAALKKKTKQVDDLQQQLDQALDENQSLKEKIKALEAIDQIIQKKKTEIAEPSE